MKIRTRPWLRVLAALLLFGLLVTLVDVSEVIDILSRVDVWWLALGLSAFAVTHLVQCLRWRACFPASQNIPFSLLTMSYVSSISVGAVLPSEYSADIVRVADAARYVSLSEAIYSVFLSRIGGLNSALFFVAVLGLISGFKYDSTGLYNAALLATVIFTMMLVMLFTPALFRLSRRILSLSWWPGKWRNRLLGMVEQYQCATARKLRMLIVLLLSLLAQAGIALIYYLVTRSLGVSLGLMDAALLTGIVTLSTIIALTPGGIGVSEGVIMLYFELSGLDRETALTVGLVMRSMLLGFALIGAIIFPFKNMFIQQATPEKPALTRKYRDLKDD